MKLQILINEELSKTIKSDVKNETEIFKYTDPIEMKKVSKENFQNNQYSGWLRGIFPINPNTLQPIDFFFWDEEASLHAPVINSIIPNNKELVIAIEAQPILSTPSGQENFKQKKYRLTGNYNFFASEDMLKTTYYKPLLYKQNPKQWHKEIMQIFKNINSKYPFKLTLEA